MNWNFQNTYTNYLIFIIVMLNQIILKIQNYYYLMTNLANELNLNVNNNEKEICDFLLGKKLDKDKFLSQAYAGHQFGHFTILGDGRALLLGEHINKNNKRFDIQLKGSGQTPYSRNGDGKATLGPMIREYIVSEAMHNLNIFFNKSISNYYYW